MDKIRQEIITWILLAISLICVIELHEYKIFYNSKGMQNVEIIDAQVPLAANDDKHYELNNRALINALKIHGSKSVLLDVYIPIEEALNYRYTFYALHPEVSLYYSPKFTLLSYNEKSELCSGYKVVFLSDGGGDKRIEELYTVRDNIVRTVSGMSDKDKIAFIQSWIKQNCTYTDSVLNQWDTCLYGCLVKGKATCLGYSEAFLYMMNEVDIPCKIITNDIHAWNEVYIDKTWKKIDITEAVNVP